MNIIKNKEEKATFIGIALGGVSTIESAVAVIDRNKHIITLDKLFSMNDVKYFIDNYAGKKESVILVSVPNNEIMLNHKWKYNSRTYDIVNFEKKIKNHDGWTNRFATRGSEYFKEINDAGIDLYRFDIENMKTFYGHCVAFKERTPIDCKSLQDTLRLKYGMKELPVNMLPVAQLESLLGAILGQMISTNDPEFTYKKIGDYENLPILGI